QNCKGTAVGTFQKPSCGRSIKPIHSIPYSVAQPLERGFNNYYSIIQGKSKYLPVEENAVSPAEIIYSEWKLSDLTGEYSKSYSNIDRCIQSFIGAKRTWDWPITDILGHLGKIDKRNKIYDSTTAQILPDEECVEVLYKIGFFRKVDRKHLSRVRYKLYYQDPSINYQLSVFDIHPAFRKKFVQY
ncbi:MAG: hypothetical protein GX424_04845, partial [Clostridiales bacterium]|nr:hypothetical protein [Clostridiales bacterium]